jgi:hypothetical protein
MPRRLCKGCDRYSIPADAPKTCKACSIPCSIVIGKKLVAQQRAMQERSRAKQARAEKQAHSRQKREFYESDIKTRKAAAIREFNTYIRERDKGLPCISCRKPVRPDDYDAGHYIPAGSNSLLRFDEVNTNGQCAFYCNHSRSGNQVEYRKGLVEKYGEAEVLRLESTSGTIKRTAEDYKKIEVEYKNKRLGLTQQTQEQAA